MAGGVLFFSLAKVPALAPAPEGTGTFLEEEVMCTADAMQCPDGTWVGRSGSNCQFVCPGEGSGGGILPYQSGIRGTVMMGPTCPVERDPPDPNCADKPLSTTVAIYRASNRTNAFAVLQSDKEGKFSASLPPGAYVVTAGGESMLPRCNPVEISVGPSSYVTTTISCDTGIR